MGPSSRAVGEGRGMAAIVSGERCGPFLILKDETGLRHAIRSSCLLALSEGSDEQDVTVAQLPGGRSMTIHVNLEEVLTWLA